MLDTANAVALVTGAAAGIGQGVAIRLARDGAVVMCADINDPEETLSAIAATGGQAEAVHLDVSSAKSWENAVGQATERRGGIDWLANIAGVPNTFGIDRVTDVTEDAWDFVLATNLKSVWLGMREVIPQMIRRGGGRIVNTSSVAGLRGIPAMAAYSASKGGIDALTRQAAVDYAADGILINSIAPGATLTSAMRAQPAEVQAAYTAGHLVGRLIEPGEIASMISFLFREGDVNTGHTYPVDFGWTARGLT